MGTTTRQVLRERLSQAIGDYYSLTSTGSGAGGGTTIVDADLANLTEDNGGIQGWTIQTSGNNAGEIRRIKNGTSGYTASSTTITLNRACTNQVASGVTYEIHRFDPTRKHDAIEIALEALFPTLYLPVIEDLVIDDRLSNSNFETWTGSAFTGWTATGSPTLSQETSVVAYPGSSAAKVVAGSLAQLTQAPAIPVNEIIGESVKLRFWVYTTAASSARIRIDFGSATESSDYHTGADQWEYIELDATVPDAATQVQVELEVAAGKTAYFDLGYLSVGSVSRYTIPTSIVHGPHFVEMQAEELNPGGAYRKFRYPVEGRVMRLRGMGLLSRPSTDSGTTEIDGPKVNLVVARAAEALFSMISGDEDNTRHNPEWWTRESIRLMSRPGIRMASMSAQNGYGSYTFEEDSSGRYIRLKALR